MKSSVADLKQLGRVYEAVLGVPEAALDAPDVLLERLADADPATLLELDSRLERAGVAQYLRKVTRERFEAAETTSDDDAPLAFSAEQLARGEQYLASMMSASDVERADWVEVEEMSVVAEVLEVRVEQRHAGHSVMTLRIDVPTEQADRWRSVRRLHVSEHPAAQGDPLRGLDSAAGT